MKNTKKILIFIVFIFSLFFHQNNILAFNLESTNIDEPILRPSDYTEYKSYGYVIDKYDVNIVVHEDNKLDITETIEVYFNKPKHGIFRTIPLRNTVSRLDGTKTNNRVKISNIAVDTNYITYKSDNNYVIKIGSQNSTLTGRHKYAISYTYDLGKDKTKKYDELYFNIIGNEWDTVIGGITFRITMPKSFDSSKLGFSKGVFGSFDSEKIIFNVNNKTITGKYNGILNVGEGLTVRCELENGYFKGRIIIDEAILPIIIPLIFLIIAVFTWFKYGKDRIAVDTVEFYPPNNMNSLEVGYYYKGEVSSEDVISLILYLANKGYIKITEIDSSKNIFMFKKLKDYDGNNENEKIFMEDLFSYNDIISTPRLQTRFYTTIRKIQENTNTMKRYIQNYEKNPGFVPILYLFMILINILLIVLVPIKGYESLILTSLICPGITSIALLVLTFKNNDKIYKDEFVQRERLVEKVFFLLLSLLYGLIPWFTMILPILIIEPIYLIGYIISLISTIGIIICNNNLLKRSEFGTKMYGRIKGFKNFIETAKKEELEKLIKQDKKYILDILPYAYVLGVSNEWIKQFEILTVAPPMWYESSSGANVNNFTRFIDTSMKEVSKTMSSTPRISTSSGSSSSGSSFGGFGGSSSGGGFSGGGSGGGGGGSW